MDLLILILFLGLIAFLSILVDRRWERRVWQRHQQQPSQTPAGPAQNASLTEQIIASWQKRMGWRAQPLSDQAKLRTWLNASLNDQPATQAWVAGLTDTEFNHLQQQLQTFCSSLQINLAWLGESALAADTALQTAIQTVVQHFVQAQQQSARVQAELRAFKHYLALTAHPYSYEQQPLIQRLYTQVVNAGLTDPARPEALLATEKLRIEHMMHAIESAATTHRTRFYQIMNELTSSAN